MVVVEMNGLMELVGLEISDDLWAKQDKDLLCGLIVAAAAQARRVAQDAVGRQYEQMASQVLGTSRDGDGPADADEDEER